MDSLCPWIDWHVLKTEPGQCSLLLYNAAWGWSWYYRTQWRNYGICRDTILWVTLLFCLSHDDASEGSEVKWVAQGNTARQKWTRVPDFWTLKDHVRFSPQFLAQVEAPLLFCSVAFQQVIRVTAIIQISVLSYPAVTKARPRTAWEVVVFQTWLTVVPTAKPPPWWHLSSQTQWVFARLWQFPPWKIALIDMFSRDWHM